MLTNQVLKICFGHEHFGWNIEALGDFLQTLGEHGHRSALLTGQWFRYYGGRLIGVGIRRIDNTRHQIIPGASHQPLWHVFYGSQFADRARNSPRHTHHDLVVQYPAAGTISLTRFTLAPLNDLSQYPLLLGLQTIGRFEFGHGRLTAGAQTGPLFQYPVQAIALHGLILQLHTH